jgi:hypothetical protein
MTAEVLELKGASYWASYLINGDASGLEPDEKALCDAWLDRELPAGFSIVNCAEESHFSWSYDLWTGSDCRGGDLLDYTAVKIGGAS